MVREKFGGMNRKSYARNDSTEQTIAGPTLLRTATSPVQIRTLLERDLPVRSLAARFAAKEAVAKALGSPGGMNWQDCEIVTDPSGAPSLRVTGTVARVADARGISTWHLSLSHDGGLAIAMVVAE